MEYPILKLDNVTIYEQIRKVQSELTEVVQATNKSPKELFFEIYDLLTSVVNLADMVNIPDLVREEWKAKMLSYQHDPRRMYIIERWVSINV